MIFTDLRYIRSYQFFFTCREHQSHTNLWKVKRAHIGIYDMKQVTERPVLVTFVVQTNFTVCDMILWLRSSISAQFQLSEKLLKSVIL